MHFFGITVVIICKFVEVVKSNAIILMPDCNNHLHTLSKKKKIVNFISFGENKGGQGKSHNAKNEQNFAPTEISGQKSGWRVQKSAGYIIRPHFTPPFKDFKFGSKTKKLWSFKVSTFPKFQKHVCPPLWK